MSIRINPSSDGLLFLSQMEDPALMEESSTLLDPSEVGRGAPLRLG